jgi:hypothetical protein
MFPLLFLPNDLLLPIIEAVEDREDLISLAQTCTRLQACTEARLFRSLFVHDGEGARELSRVLRRQPQRLEYVQSIEITPRRGEWQGMEAMPYLVRRMTNLRHLQYGLNFSWQVENNIAIYMAMFARANASNDNDRPLRNVRSRECYRVARRVGTGS